LEYQCMWWQPFERSATCRWNTSACDDSLSKCHLSLEYQCADHGTRCIWSCLE